MPTRRTHDDKLRLVGHSEGVLWIASKGGVLGTAAVQRRVVLGIPRTHEHHVLPRVREVVAQEDLLAPQ